jgi:hypothetical protein
VTADGDEHSAANPPDQRANRKLAARSQIERHGARVLLGAGVVAWALAIWQVEHEAVATSWALSGFLLIVAAAFYSRVLEVGRDGVKLADVFDALDDVAPDDTTDEVKAKVLDEVAASRSHAASWYSHYASWLQADPVDDPWRRALLLQRSWQTGRLCQAFRDWLEREGWQVTDETANHRFRVDLVARRGNETLYAEVRSAVTTLATPDARRIVASLEELPLDGSRALVFAEGTAITLDAITTLRAADIQIYYVDPDSGAARPA